MPKRQRPDADGNLDMSDVSYVDAVSKEDLSDLGEQIMVDFEFFQFNADDYHDLKPLFNKYLSGEEFDIGGLVDELIEQFYIGSVIKVEGSGQAVGFITAFNIIKHNALSSIQSIKQFFLNNLVNPEERSSLEVVLSGGKGPLALIFSERIETVPVLLAPPMYQQLTQEIASALKTEKDDGLTEFEYDIQYFLIKIPVFYTASSNPNQYRQDKKSKVDQLGDDLMIPGSERNFIRPEEELLANHAEKIWRCNVRHQEEAQSLPHSMDGIQVMREENWLALIPASAITHFLKDCEEKQRQTM